MIIINTMKTLIFFILFAVALLFLTPHDTVYNGPYRLALEMLQGRLYLPERFPWMEMYQYDGNFYIGYPPMVTVAIAPIVWLTGGLITQSYINMFLYYGTSIFIYLILYKILIPHSKAKVAALLGSFAYLFATPICISVYDSGVWNLMHAEGNFFLALAIYLALVRNRFFWSGTSFIIAAQCRYSILLGGLALLMIAWKMPLFPLSKGTWRSFFLRCLRFAAGTLPPLVVVLLLQEGMTGSMFVSPYTMQWREWHRGEVAGDSFSWKYFLPNLEFYLFSRPEFMEEFPYLKFTYSGQSIWIMSPFFFGMFAFFRLRSIAVRCLLAGASAMFIFYLFWNYTGYAQIGNRYMSDLYPFLVVIAIAGFFPFKKFSRTLLALAFLYSGILLWVIVPLSRAVTKFYLSGTP